MIRKILRTAKIGRGRKPFVFVKQPAFASFCIQFELYVSKLPGIIHHNQSGYIPGRNIGENIRSIIDIMSFTRAKNLPGLLLFNDFEKAFDSLEW